MVKTGKLGRRRAEGSVVVKKGGAEGSATPPTASERGRPGEGYIVRGRWGCMFPKRVLPEASVDSLRPSKVARVVAWPPD